MSASATLMNGAGWDFGAHGAALKLDGKNDYALTPEMVGNPALTQMAFCVWAKFASTRGRHYLLDDEKHTNFLLVDERKSGAAVRVSFGRAGN